MGLDPDKDGAELEEIAGSPTSDSYVPQVANDAALAEGDAVAPKNGDDSLEGKIVLIAGSSKISQQFRDDLFRDFEQDHQIGDRVVRLNVVWSPYNNDEENFQVVDPDGVLTMDQITHLIRNSDNYFVGKLENPALRDPLKYHLDTLVANFSRCYFNLKAESGITETKLKERFQSYVAINLPEILGEVINRSVLENEIFPIAARILKKIKAYEADLKAAFDRGLFKDERAPKNFDNEVTLEDFRDSLSGYLYKKMNPRSKQISLDEIRSVSFRVGREILSDDCDGRLSWVTPFVDGRSDDNVPSEKKKKANPHEGMRAKEFAFHAGLYGIERVLMLRAHSKEQMDFFEDYNVRVDNLTQTNEYVSRLAQDMRIDFTQMYVLSPDAGGLADAMVFARELHRRTQGKFTGRVVLFEKERLGAGKIGKMGFLKSYVYNRAKDSDEDYNKRDKSKHPLPYDHPLQYAGEYKDPDDPKWIGNLFDVEYDSSDMTKDQVEQVLEELKGNISGHKALIRDDILDTGGTMLTACGLAYVLFGSRSIAMIEHPCMTQNAIEKLDEAYRKGHLERLYTSTSIEHPNEGTRPWHKRVVLSRRFYSHVRRQYLAWLKEHLPEVHQRIHKYDAMQGSDDSELPEFEEMQETLPGIFDQSRGPANA